MKMIDFNAIDGKVIKLYYWDEVKKPKAVVQIFHAMSEHMGRFDEFATFLNEQGFIVVGDDQRGFGLTAGTRKQIGLCGGENIFDKTLLDKHEITKWIEQKYELPIIVFSHSYGAYLAQRYIQQKRGIAGCVLMGTSYLKSAMFNMGYLISKFGMKKPDEKGLIFLKPFIKVNNRYGTERNLWLTRDKSVIDKYNTDELCSKVPSNAFYHYMMKGVKQIYKPENIEKVDKKLPILLMAGLDDGATDNGDGTKKLLKKHHEWGYNSTALFYEGARHDLLHELNKDDVYCDIVVFFDDCLNNNRDYYSTK